VVFPAGHRCEIGVCFNHRCVSCVMHVVCDSLILLFLFSYFGLKNCFVRVGISPGAPPAPVRLSGQKIFEEKILFTFQGIIRDKKKKNLRERSRRKKRRETTEDEIKTIANRAIYHRHSRVSSFFLSISLFSSPPRGKVSETGKKERAF